MTTLAIPCAMRNLRKQQRKLSGRFGSRFTQHPDLIDIAERPMALAWASVFNHLTHGSQA